MKYFIDSFNIVRLRYLYLLAYKLLNPINSGIDAVDGFLFSFVVLHDTRNWI